jgi:hypothetical protein
VLASTSGLVAANRPGNDFRSCLPPDRLLVGDRRHDQDGDDGDDQYGIHGDALASEFAPHARYRQWVPGSTCAATGLLLPRWLVIGPALTGSTYAVAHALTAYVTKPLHALGIVHLRFDGWAQRDQTAQFLWDLLFYEPWFLGLGVLVTLGATHHHRRTGGSARGEWRLLVLTALATLALTVFACTLVVLRSL